MAMGKIATALFLLFASAASAQEMEQQRPKCTGAPAPLPASLSGWSSKAPLTAASDEAGLSSVTLMAGKAAMIALHPTRQVHYLSQPEKPGGSVAHGGLARISITTAGTYQVSLNSGAWLDVLKDGKMLESTAHGPGPACTGIGKTVQFPLQPGQYVLQISANADPTIAVMVSKVP
jgi:hypothetical protein